MRILVTNDDGICADSLECVVQWAKKYGEVEIFAPRVEQSAKSHAVELYKPFEVKPVERTDGIIAYSVDSTPADCVRIAVLGMKRKYDLVISGINKGFNIGLDILYSGTVSAALEAAMLGIRSIALSSYPGLHKDAMRHMDRVYGYICDHELFEANLSYNVNIPEEGGRIRITRQGGAFYSDDFAPLDENHDMYMPKGKCVYEYSADHTLDTDTVLHDKCISIMPLTYCSTALDVYEKLK